MKGHEPVFAKTPGQKINFGDWFYLNQSSEADIQPNLYNQALSIIFAGLPSFLEFYVFENFVFQKISVRPISGRERPKTENPEMQNSQKHKILEHLGGLKNDRQGLVI